MTIRRDGFRIYEVLQHEASLGYIMRQAPGEFLAIPAAGGWSARTHCSSLAWAREILCLAAAA